jgi:ankyrin repeat protein
LSTSSPEEALDGWLGSLHIAAKKGNDLIVRVLLQQGNLDCDERDSDGRTALMHAVIEGHEAVVRSLLAHGARVGEVDRDRRSAIHLAVLYQREGILRDLLSQGEQGLDVNGYDVAGWTPLHIAIERNFEVGIILLLQAGANLGSKARKCPFLAKENRS